jgi:hypothetical protein
VHFAHRLAPEVGDPVGGGRDALVGDGRAERLGLDDDQADVVRDDVVELLGDAQPLLGDRALGQQLALAVQVLGALAQRLEARAAAADVEPDPAGDGAQHPGGHKLARGEVSARELVGEAGRDDRSGGRQGGLPRAPGADRVKHRGDRERELRFDGRRDGDGEDHGERRERPAPAKEQRQDRADAPQQPQQRAALLRAVRGRADHERYPDERGEPCVDHARRRPAQPRGKGRGHARSVSPARWPVG